MSEEGHVYFHSPCFDGIASAVLVQEFLESRHFWAHSILRPVNYDLRDTWLATPLETPAAVVDFLYHPDATFWADHHITTFLDDAARSDFQRRRGPGLVYDESAGSCARLLQRHLEAEFRHRNERHEELVRWAEKTDAARYDSPREAVLGTAPAQRINLSLVFGGEGAYCERLVEALHGSNLEDVANLPEVEAKYKRARGLIRSGLDRFKQVARVEPDGIVVFDVDGSNTIVSRYAPYYYFPEARYSVGIVRSENGAKVTAMRNPWMEFESVPLGMICEALGGGGHRRVGSIALDKAGTSRAAEILDRLIEGIRRGESDHAHSRSA
jgi:hypothetical protein